MGDIVEHGNLTVDDSILIPSADDFLPEGFSSELKVVLALLYSFTAGGAIFGNGVVAVVMVTSPALRTVTNMFVMSLVVSDTLVAAWNVPLQLTFYMDEEWRLGGAMCRLTSYVLGVSITASILTMVAVALERYYVICRPMQARFVRTKKSAFCAIFVVWAAAIFIMLPQLWIQRLQERLAWQLESYPPIRIAYLCVEYFETRQLSVLYSYSVLILLYVAPIAVMSFAYGKMVGILWSRRPIDDSMLTPQPSDKREVQRRNVVKMLITVLTLFAVCWFPFFVIQIVLLYHELGYTLRVVQALFLLLGYANSLINPLVYFFMNNNFKRALVKKVKKFNSKRRNTRIIRQRSTLETESGV